MKTPNEYCIWKHLVLWAVVFLIIAWRLLEYWQSGEFVGEDAWVFFANAYNKDWTVSIFTPYAGYFHLLPRILAELFSSFPIVYQPYAYAIFGMAVNAFILSIFYFPHFKGVILQSWARAGIVILLAFSGNAENLGLLLGLHWYLAFAMALMLVMQPPSGRVGRMAMSAGSFVSIWSSPSTMILFPFLFFKWKKEKDPFYRHWCLFSISNLIIVGVFIVWMRIQTGERTSDFLFSHLPIAIDRLVLRGWLGCGLLGKSLTGVILSFHGFILYLWSVSWLVFFFWIGFRFWKKTQIRNCMVLLGMALLMVFFSLSRSLYLAEMEELDLPRHVRYLTAPTLLLIIAIWGIADGLWIKRYRLLLCLCWAIQFYLLLIGIPKLVHWSRTPEDYRLRDFVPAIHSFEEQYRKTGTASSLYIPMDIPYWGPVLKKGGGLELLPPSKLAEGLGLQISADGFYDSWLGRFKQVSDSTFIEHEKLGLLDSRGLSEGRVWFRDSEDKLLFSSPLLYPRFWIMEGLQFSHLEVE